MFRSLVYIETLAEFIVFNESSFSSTLVLLQYTLKIDSSKRNNTYFDFCDKRLTRNQSEKLMR